MNFVLGTFAVIIGLMLAEARVSRAHERVLRGRGAIEPPGDVFRLMAVLYPGAFLAMAAEGVWRVVWLPTLVAPGAGPAWAASGALLFVVAKWLKYWAIGALGPRWTFRVLVPPGEPLVSLGPYRYVAHPNYVAVVGELVGAAMMFGALVTGPTMVVLFGLVLRKRIYVEARALHDLAKAREGAI